MCESQFNAIQRNLDNPALQPQRDRLIQLQVNILSSFLKKTSKKEFIFTFIIFQIKIVSNILY